MLESRPEFITLIISFDLKSPNAKNLTGKVRRDFMGKKINGRFNIPKIMQELMGSDNEIIYPKHLAFIKDPKKILMPELGKDKYGRTIFRIRNPARGAMIHYRYLGSYKDLGILLNVFNELLKEKKREKKPTYLSAFSDIEIIIGKDLENVK